jgi:hypothetical protein
VQWIGTRGLNPLDVHTMILAPGTMMQGGVDLESEIDEEDA